MATRARCGSRPCSWSSSSLWAAVAARSGRRRRGGSVRPSLPPRRRRRRRRRRRSPSTRRQAEAQADEAPSKPTAATTTTIVFVNVGQGDAEIIKSGSWTGLIDGGPSGSEQAIESVPRKLGVSRLNAVVVTHPHADHTGGLSGVVYDYRPKLAYVGEGAGNATSALRAVGAHVTRARRGMTLRFGSAAREGAQPGVALRRRRTRTASCCSSTPAARSSCSPATARAPTRSLVGSICARGPPLYLLKVAHHGSRYSTSSSFLSETNPKFAVISVGPNSYGHPTPETISALKADGTRIYSTQKNGTVTLTISSSGGVSWTFADSSKPVIGAGNSSSSTGGGGGSSSGSSSSSGGGSGKVYVTETGECYHLGGCQYLSHSKIPISLKDAKAQGYRACSVCDPPQ